MVKKTDIIICDICKERIAKEKCRLCKNDICNYKACKKDFMIKLSSSGEEIISVPFCRVCWDKIGEKVIHNRDFWEEEFLKKMSKDFEDYIRKRVIIDKLEDKKEEK